MKIWDLSTGLCKETFQIPATRDLGWAGSGAQMIDGRLIFVWYKDHKIHIWDTKKDELLQTLDTPVCYDLKLSGDGSKILFLGDQFIQAWSMWSWESVGRVELGLKVVIVCAV